MPYKDKLGRLCGFLNLEDTENSGVFVRRYFVLDQRNDKLLYYMDNPNNLPLTWANSVGEMNLQYISQVSDGRKVRSRIPFCFVITMAGQRYFLEAENEEDMEAWVTALNMASKIQVPRNKKGTDSGQVEWTAGDLTQTSYTTEIAGGVVCKMPVKEGEDKHSDGESEDESRSTSSGKISPAGSVSQPPLCQPVFPAAIDSTSALSAVESGKSNSLPANRVPSIKDGYCVKQGAVRKSWKRRYFVLNKQGLSYYKSDTDKVPIRTIDLSDIQEVKQSVGTHTSRDNLFEVKTSKRTFYAQCDSPEEMQSWIKAIRMMIHNRKLEEEGQGSQGGGNRRSVPEEAVKPNSNAVWAMERQLSATTPGRRHRHRKKLFVLW